MISPVFATIILIAFLLIFGVLLPFLNVRCPRAVSFRWMCMVVILALLIGCVIDFAELDNDSRYLVLLCGLIITGLYILLRTIEKLAVNKDTVALKLRFGEKAELNATMTKEETDDSHGGQICSSKK